MLKKMWICCYQNHHLNQSLHFTTIISTTTNTTAHITITIQSSAFDFATFKLFSLFCFLLNFVRSLGFSSFHSQKLKPPFTIHFNSSLTLVTSVLLTLLVTIPIWVYPELGPTPLKAVYDPLIFDEYKHGEHVVRK